MKKRFLCCVLILALILSSIPGVSASEEMGTEKNPHLIASWEDFQTSLLRDRSSTTTVYYRLINDIYAPADTVLAESFTASNIILEGNGFRVGGFTVENALFSALENSAIRNVTFTGITVIGDGLEQAVLALEIDDLSFVTGCTFNQCTVNLPQGETELSAAVVTANNYGTITNCIVNNNCIISGSDSVSTEDHLIGGIAAVNYGAYGFIVNCISKATFSLGDGSLSTIGGIAAENQSTIAFCYADTTAPSTTATYDAIAPINNGRYDEIIQCVRREENGYSVLEGIKDYPSDISVYELAAEMSESAMNNYNQNLDMDFFSEAEYACLWSVENGDLALSLDGKTGQIYLYMDSTMSDCSIRLTDKNALELPVTEGDNSICRKFSTRVGDHTQDGYTRNSFTVTLYTQWDQMVNNFILLPNASYVTKLPNTMDGTEGTYPQTMYLAPGRSDYYDWDNEISLVSNYASQKLYPFSMTLSLRDELVAYRFDGAGTAAIPYQIKNERELCVLSDYVNNGVVYGDLPYSQAHYVLTADLNMASLSNNNHFEAIGAFGAPFQGVFDGRGHWIKNLRLVTSQSYQGLFGYVEGIQDGDTYQNAVIKDLVVYDAVINDGDNLTHGSFRGGVVGQASHTSIIGCVSCSNLSGYTQIGGIVGYAYHCDIIGCGSYSPINTYSAYAWAGGIVGYADNSRIENCYACNVYRFHDVVEEHTLRVGSIAGNLQDSQISHCYYVPENNEVFPYHSGITKIDYDTLISNDFAVSLSTYSEQLGLDVLWKSRADETFFPCPVPIMSKGSEHSISCTTTSHGALSPSASRAYMGSIITIKGIPITAIDNYDNPYDYQAQLMGIKLTDVNGKPLDIAITANEDGTFEFVMPDYSVCVTPVYECTYFIGSGTLEDPYLLSTYQDLDLLSDLSGMSGKDNRIDFLSACYLMTNDIDCNGQILFSIGNRFLPFDGRFDGGGYMISNLILRNNVIGTGLFGFVKGGRYDVSVTNLTLKNITMPDSYGAFLAHFACGDQAVVFSNICIMDSQTADEGCCLVYAPNSDVTFVNCVLSNITFNTPYYSALLVCCTDVYSAYTITAKNLLLENINGADRLLGEATYGNETVVLDGLYYSGTSISDLYKYQFDGEVLELDKSQLNDQFIADRSAAAKNELAEYGAFPWGRDDDNRIRIAINDAIPGIYHISYDKIFSTSVIKLLDMDRAPHTATAGETVVIPFNSNVSLADLKINAGAVRFVSDFSANEIQFTMPNETVQITNNGQPIVHNGLTGAGTADNPYLIQSTEDLLLFASVMNKQLDQDLVRHNQDYVNACFRMTADLDMTGINWEGIGTTGIHFNGTFDGNGYAIENLNIDTGKADGYRQGLFMILGEKALVQDLTIRNADIFSDNITVAGAGAVSKSNYGTIRRCIVEDSSIQLGNWVHLGGISGVNQSTGVIEYCAVINTLLLRRWGGTSSQTMGGITQNNLGRVAYCYSYNCNLSNGTASNGAIIASGNTPINCAYYTPSNTVALNGTYAKTIDEFASGAVAYMLNGNSSEHVVWYQEITMDQYPVLIPSFIVYKNSDGTYTNASMIGSNKPSNPNTGDLIIGTEVLLLMFGFTGLTVLIAPCKRKKK